MSSNLNKVNMSLDDIIRSDKNTGRRGGPSGRGMFRGRGNFNRGGNQRRESREGNAMRKNNFPRRGGFNKFNNQGDQGRTRGRINADRGARRIRGGRNMMERNNQRRGQSGRGMDKVGTYL